MIPQCHRYKEYESSPMYTRTLLDKISDMVLFFNTKILAPAMHGIRAKTPGKGVSSV